MPFMGDMTGAPATGAYYSISNSVMLDGVADYFTRTPVAAGNRQEFTLLIIFKRAKIGADQKIFSVYGSASDTGRFDVRLNSSDQLQIEGDATTWRISNRTFKDTTAWYCLVISAKTTDATASNRLRVYDGLDEITSWSTNNAVSLNHQFAVNDTVAHYIGRQGASASGYFSGYVSFTSCVDGTQLTASSWVEADVSTGSWKPKAPSGLTYGTNGFYLDFANTADLGNDVSGNNNDWTRVSIDSNNAVIDTPTNNFSVLNALRPSTSALSDGNRTATGTASGTIPVSQSDKWYWEVTANAVGVTAGLENESGTTYTTSVTNGTTMSFRYTHSTTTLENSSDGSSWSTVSSSVVGVAFPYVTGASSTTNFGASSFLRTPSTGFNSLCTDKMDVTTGVTSGSFIGNASSDGPCVWTGAPPATLTIDGNAVTWGTHADKLAGGFKIRTASSPYNDAATNNWTATYETPQKPFVGSNKVPGKAQGNP